MLLKFWTWFGNLSLGIFVGFLWAVAVMWNWYRLMDLNGWDGSTAPNALFIFHLLVSAFGALFVGRVVFRWATNRVATHDARVLRDLWITRRANREMAEVTRQNIRNIS